jgi:hypothetical protein
VVLILKHPKLLAVLRVLLLEDPEFLAGCGAVCKVVVSG